MELQLNKIHCGDNVEVMKPFPSDSVDLVVTSPPYWGLRDYGTGEDQLGLEPHPQMYVDNLVVIFREVKRVLKPSGSFWLNLGDSYYGSGKGAGGDLNKSKEVYQMPKSSVPKQKERSNWLQPKQKLMMPHRVAIALQDDGWILRNDVIWYKRNHMPEPVQDRLTKSYENFFFFVKSRKYYFDLDAIRESYKDLLRPNLDGGSATQGGIPRVKVEPRYTKMGEDGANTGDNNKPPYSANNPHKQRLIDGNEAGHQKGKNPGDMWSILTHPFPGSHFAVFPPKLIEPIIKAACPDNGVVLDPFAGSGTALRVARKLGRNFIGIEINPEYAKMCEARVRGDSYTPPPEGVPKLSTFSKTKRIEK